MATDVQTLIEEAKCFGCLGMTPAEMIRLALLKRISENCYGAPPSCTDILTLSVVIGDTFRIVLNPTVLEVHFPNLTTLTNASDNGELVINETALLRAFTAPNLQTTEGNLFLTGPNQLISVSFPSLTDVGITLGTLDMSTSATLNSVSFPLLATVNGAVYFDNCPLLSELEFPSLTSITAEISATNNVVMTSVDLPALIMIGGDTVFSGCTLLRDWNAPNWVPTDGTLITFQNDDLNVASIAQILARCRAAAVTTCTITLNGGTNAARPTWTLQAQNDEIWLTVAGNIVTWNP